MIFRGGRLDEATDDVVDAFAFWAARVRTIRGLDPDRSLDRRALGRRDAVAARRCATGSEARSLACCFGLYEVDHLRGPAGAAAAAAVSRPATAAAGTARLPRHHAHQHRRADAAASRHPTTGSSPSSRRTIRSPPRRARPADEARDLRAHLTASSTCRCRGRDAASREIIDHVTR